MAAATYNFYWTGVNKRKIDENMPEGVQATVGAVNPKITVSVELNPDSTQALEDLIGAMAEEGWHIDNA